MVVIFSILVIGCSSQESIIGQETPSSTWNLYDKAVNEFDVNTIEKVTTENFRTKFQQKGFEFSKLQEIFENIGIANSTCEIIDIVEISENKVELKCQPVFYSKLGSRSENPPESFIVIKKDNNWFIDDFVG